MTEKKKVLFTGGSGLLAVNWAMDISDTCHTINALHDRNIQLPGLTTTPLALDDRRVLSETLVQLMPDVVVHCASYTTVEGCEADPARAEFVNVTLTENTASACLDNGIRFVYISTDHLFDGKRSLYTENEPVRPINVYGKTKARGEEKTLAVSDSFLCIRTNFYGWGTSYRKSFSDTILQSLRAGSRIGLFSDAFYSPILMQTLSHTVMQLIDGGAHGIYNVAGAERLSKFAFGEKLADQYGLDASLIDPIHVADRKGLVQRPLDLSLSDAKARAFLNHDFGELANDLRELKKLEESGFAQKIQSV